MCFSLSLYSFQIKALNYISVRSRSVSLFMVGNASTQPITVACHGFGSKRINPDFQILDQTSNSCETRGTMEHHWHRTIDGQLQSNLFNKLSPEIRSMAWKEVILDDDENAILHIIPKKNSLTHVRCNAPEGGYDFSTVAQSSWGVEHEHCYFSGIHDAKYADTRKIRVLLLVLSFQRI